MRFLNSKPKTESARETNARKKALRIRFGLKSLFALLTLISILFGCLWNVWWIPWQHQKASVELIESRWDLGLEDQGLGDYQYESMDKFPWWKKQLAAWLGRDSVARVTRVFSENDIGVVDISTWKGLGSVEYVGFDRATVNDLSVLENFQYLKSFNAYQTSSKPGVDPGLGVLGKCKRLENIKLTSSFKLNDKSFDLICGASNIRCLNFEVEDCLRDLKPMARLQKLEELEIFVGSENGLPDMNFALPSLRKLNLRFFRGQLPEDWSFLRQMPRLESVEIDASLSKEQRAAIRSSLAAECELLLSSGGIKYQD